MIKDELIMIREDGFTDQGNDATRNVPTFLVGGGGCFVFPHR
jgi:hypothetical protein